MTALDQSSGHVAFTVRDGSHLSARERVAAPAGASLSAGRSRPVALGDIFLTDGAPSRSTRHQLRLLLARPLLVRGPTGLRQRPRRTQILDAPLIVHAAGTCRSSPRRAGGTASACSPRPLAPNGSETASSETLDAFQAVSTRRHSLVWSW
jgi:hypothetical protein